MRLSVTTISDPVLKIINARTKISFFTLPKSQNPLAAHLGDYTGRVPEIRLINRTAPRLLFT